MAKISFTKLGLKINQDIKTIEYNGQNIEVKQYLPIQDKLQLISDIINQAMDQDLNFVNPVKLDAFIAIGIIKYYTNIGFTEKQLEDPKKIYDLIYSSGLISIVLNNISSEEYDKIYSGTIKTIKSFYEYKNSVMGILDTISQSYDESSFNLKALVDSIKDPEALGVLREIAPFMV